MHLGMVECDVSCLHSYHMNDMFLALNKQRNNNTHLTRLSDDREGWIFSKSSHIIIKCCNFIRNSFSGQIIVIFLSAEP